MNRAYRIIQSAGIGLTVAVAAAVISFLPGAEAAGPVGKDLLEQAWSSPPRQEEELPPLRISSPVFYRPTAGVRAVPFKLPAPPSKSEGRTMARTVASQTGEGYRVQLFAGADQSSARTVESRLQKSAPYPVYMIYETPQYKVRVGNFLEREEAVRACQEMKQAGFPDAWVVRSAINIAP